jgi:hypothetical protein
MIKRIVIIVMVFSLVNCKNTKDEFLINEGHGVNIFKLGIKISESPKEIDGITLMVNSDSLIHAIDIKSTAYHTKDNLKVGINYETILKQRGMYDTTKVINKANPTNIEQNNIPQSMRYDGITFFLDDKGIVEKIRVH